MRKYVFAAALSVMVLAVGCSSDSADISIGPADETAVVVTTAAATEKEESGEGKTDEGNSEAEESLKAREEELNSLAESLKAAEESLTEAEESLQEAMSSEAGETAEEESEEETTTVAYEALIESAAEYKDTEVTYTGRVIQAVTLEDDTMQLLIAVDGDDSTRLVGEYARDVFSGALARGDTVTVKGTFVGVNRYMTGNGERVELPSMEISEITVDSPAETEPEAVILETEEVTVPEMETASAAVTEESTEETSRAVQGPIAN